MAREIEIDYEDIQNPQSITKKNIEEFEKNDLDIHRHEVMEIIDDDKKKKRIIKVKNTKYFIMG